jgi:hypothetical protein
VLLAVAAEKIESEQVSRLLSRSSEKLSVDAARTAPSDQEIASGSGRDRRLALVSSGGIGDLVSAAERRSGGIEPTGKDAPAVTVLTLPGGGEAGARQRRQLRKAGDRIVRGRVQ